MTCFLVDPAPAADRRYASVDKRSKLPQWVKQFLPDAHISLSTDMSIHLSRKFLKEMAQPVPIGLDRGKTLLSIADIDAMHKAAGLGTAIPPSVSGAAGVAALGGAGTGMVVSPAAPGATTTIAMVGSVPVTVPVPMDAGDSITSNVLLVGRGGLAGGSMSASLRPSLKPGMMSGIVPISSLAGSAAGGAAASGAAAGGEAGAASSAAGGGGGDPLDEALAAAAESSVADVLSTREAETARAGEPLSLPASLVSTLAAIGDAEVRSATTPTVPVDDTDAARLRLGMPELPAAAPHHTSAALSGAAGFAAVLPVAGVGGAAGAASASSRGVAGTAGSGGGGGGSRYAAEASDETMAGPGFLLSVNQVTSTMGGGAAASSSSGSGGGGSDTSVAGHKRPREAMSS